MTAPPMLTHWGGGRWVQPGGGEVRGSSEEDGGADSSFQTLTEDNRHGDSSLSQELGNAGLTSLADKKQLCQWSTGIA